MTEPDVCQICSTFTRNGATLCPSCWMLTRTPEPCACGHDSIEHDGACLHSWWNARGRYREGCQCKAFKGVAA